MTATTPIDAPPMATLPRPGHRDGTDRVRSDLVVMSERFDLALAAWDRNRLNAYAYDAAEGEGPRADSEELDIALQVLSAPAPTIDCVLGKLRVIMEYVEPGAGVMPTAFERLSLIGLHTLHIDLMSIER